MANPIKRIFYIFRSSRTGRFITKDQAEAKPAETTRERAIRDMLRTQAERDRHPPERLTDDEAD